MNLELSGEFYLPIGRVGQELLPTSPGRTLYAIVSKGTYYSAQKWINSDSYSQAMIWYQ